MLLKRTEIYHDFYVSGIYNEHPVDFASALYQSYFRSDMFTFLLNPTVENRVSKYSFRS